MRNRGFKHRNDQGRDDRCGQVNRQPRQTPARGFQDTVRKGAFPNPGKAHHILFIFFIEHDHRVINGDHPDESIIGVNNRRRNQMILIKRIGHVFFRLIHWNGAKTIFGNLKHRSGALGPQKFAKCDIAGGTQTRVDEDHMVKLLGQIFLTAQVINRLTHIPMLRGHDNFALHEAAGRFLWESEGLLNNNPFRMIQCAKDGLLLWLVEILEQIHHIVRIQIAHRNGQLGRVQPINDVFADTVVQFGQNIAIDAIFPQLQDTRTDSIAHLL